MSRLFGLVLLVLVTVMSISVVKAQSKTCNLYFKIYDYNADSPKNRLQDVNITIKNVETKKEQSLNLSLMAKGFENLTDGKYRVEVNKKGYKQKNKDIKIECEFADKENNFWHYLYLFRDKSNFDRELIDDEIKIEPKGESSSNNLSKSNALNEFGKVTVEITIDEDGNVISAEALDGKPKLAEASVKAARQSKFAPTKLAGNPVKVKGNIIYNFVP